MNLYAHSPPMDFPGAPWHGLGEHLQGCGEKAGARLTPIGQAEWGKTAGLLHDLGKATPEWQAYLQASAANPEGTHARVDHKLSGALLAHREAGGRALPMTLGIAGHHGGLHDLEDLKAKLSESGREDRLGRALGNLPVTPVFPPLPAWIGANKDKRRNQTSLECFTRILFSALVDGDFLDTEGFYARCGQADSRKGWEARGQAPSIEDYLPLA